MTAQTWTETTTNGSFRPAYGHQHLSNAMDNYLQAWDGDTDMLAIALHGVLDSATYDKVMEALQV
jgi:hypothetical protein